jgi:nitroimidazol reductase NimA-like FMN-containing flavoprotein (pyridoxamine 5'-phosphate oxidase superfamily)
MDGRAFLVSTEGGDIPFGLPHGFGLFHRDCRFLDGLELTVNGKALTVLSGRGMRVSETRHYLTNPELPGSKGRRPIASPAPFAQSAERDPGRPRSRPPRAHRGREASGSGPVSPVGALRLYSRPMPARLSSDEVRAFLDSKPGWIVLSTIGIDGYPHSVPLGYFRLGNDVYMGCRANTQKLRNIARNSRVALVLESGRTMQEIKGVMIQGDATVYAGAEDVLRLSREAARLRGVAEEALPMDARPGAAYIGVVPRRVISWDYGR